MDMLDTLKGSYFSEVLPEGWDIAKIKECVSNPPESVFDRQSFRMMLLRSGEADQLQLDSGDAWQAVLYGRACRPPLPGYQLT